MPTLLDYARSMRREPTPAERKLWHALRNWQINGLKFRRQVPIEGYIADFYCPPLRLVIEVDGETHADSRTDAARDRWMQGQGLQILRVANTDVMSNLPGVLQAIASHAISPAPCARPPRASCTPP